MLSIADFLKKTADKSGFIRDRFEEKRLPTDFDDITVVPFFGDYRGTFVLSSWLLHRFKTEQRPGKYLILASWPGMQGLFPYVDEYWSIRDDSSPRKMYEAAEGFQNKSGQHLIYMQNLNEGFRDVSDWKSVAEPYYRNGITQEFWDKYRVVKRFLPHVPSSALLGKEFNRELASRAGFKVFIHPLRWVNGWRNGRVKLSPAPKEFWVFLAEKLISQGYCPVVWQTGLTHDISPDLVDKCVYLVDKDITKAAAAMRASGCVLDLFGDVNRLAAVARTPYLCVTERLLWSNRKEYELDDLCSPKLPKEYIFTFSTIISDGIKQSWNHELFGNIAARLKTFLPDLDRDSWPSTGEETETVMYGSVRKHQNKKIGARLLKITRD